METQHEPEDQPESFKVGSQFLIRLNEYEISKGIFIIGHRLVPFRSDRSSVSKLRFEDADGHQIKLRIAGIALTQALQYFAIYGGLFVAKRLFDEDEANGPMIGSAKPSPGQLSSAIGACFPSHDTGTAGLFRFEVSVRTRYYHRGNQTVRVPHTLHTREQDAR